MLFSHISINPVALRKAKIVYNFGLSESNRVKMYTVAFSSMCNEGLQHVFFTEMYRNYFRIAYQNLPFQGAL